MGSPDLKPLLPQGPGFRPLPVLPSMCLVLENEQCSFSVYRASGKNSQGPGPRLLLALPNMLLVLDVLSLYSKATGKASVDQSTPPRAMACRSVLKEPQYAEPSNVDREIQPQKGREEMPHDQRRRTERCHMTRDRAKM